MYKFLISLIILFFSTAIARTDEYFCLLFSHDSKPAKATNSHTWAAFVKVGDDRNLKEKFTISWNPRRPWHFASGKLPGYNATLKSSIEAALFDPTNPREITMWGPYSVRQSFYVQALRRYHDLNDFYYYRALDTKVSRWFRRRRPATNCIHAVSDIIPGLTTGAKYGEKATQAVVDHFIKHGEIDNGKRVSITGEKILADLGLNNYKGIKRK